MNYFLLSLGCPKNEVDAEAMSSILKKEGFKPVENPEEAEVFIVNTCAFIEPARREAVEAILDVADYKQARLEKENEAYLVITGCLPQMLAEEVYKCLPEVDACLGTAEYHKIAECIKQLKTGKFAKNLPMGRGSLEHLIDLHEPSLDRKFAYLKISEGCNNGCAFCAIPSIRGGQKSRTIESLVKEAEYYASLGIEELILVAQDTTRYGIDIYDYLALSDLLRALVKIDGVKWIRLMYVYGDAFSDELIQLMANEPKLVPYIDIPIQHASNRVLERMRRRETKESILTLINNLRENIPALILRSTVMVGFPGETEEDFIELLELIEEVRFDRLGCFIFSPEEGTIAAGFTDTVDSEIALERYNKLMKTQAKISLKSNQARVGQVCDILIEGIAEDSPFFIGRSFGEAPEIDPEIFVLALNPNIKVGDFVSCRIMDADEYTLTAASIEENFDEFA